MDAARSLPVRFSVNLQTFVDAELLEWLEIIKLAIPKSRSKRPDYLANWRPNPIQIGVAGAVESGLAPVNAPLARQPGQARPAFRERVPNRSLGKRLTAAWRSSARGATIGIRRKPQRSHSPQASCVGVLR